jgi:probable phosphoglycerate mutase
MQNKTTLLIIRHGETVWNLEKRIQGHLDSDLSELGYAQAEALSRAFAGITTDVLYSSDLGRAKNTAAGIERTTGLKAIEKTCLRESNLGIMQGKTRDELEQLFPSEHAWFRSRDPHYVVPDGESLAQRHARAVTCLNEIAASHTGQTVTVVTHGGVLDSVFRHVFGIPLDVKRRFSIYNASISSFKVCDGRWHLYTWGDLRHLAGVEVHDEQNENP